MAELVYAFDLKSNGETRAGSIPAPSTIKPKVLESHSKPKTPRFTGVFLVSRKYS